MTMICRVPAVKFMGLVLAAGWLALAGCASTSSRSSAPPPNAHYKIGSSYKIGGRWYHPKADAGYDRKGVASWYGDAFHGKPTANGEIFDQHRLSAAHTTLPLPSLVEVENLENGRRVVVRVNDRGPFVDDRLIDLSRAAADALGFLDRGLAKVRVKYLGYAELHARAPRKGSSEGTRPVRTGNARVANASPNRRINQAGQSTPLPQPPPAPSSDASFADGDPIGQLITESAIPATPRVAPATRVSSRAPPTPSLRGQGRADDPFSGAGLLYWVEIESFYDLESLENARLSLQETGPLAVFSQENEGVSAYTLRMGPYGDPGIAEAQARRAVDAGFANARLVGPPL